MNEVDLVVILIIALSVYHGATRGVLTGAVDLGSLLLALIIGSSSWRIAAALFRFVGFPEFLAGLLGFASLTMGLAVGCVYLGLWLLRNVKPSKWTDRIGGGAFGFIFGFLLAALILMASGALPNAYKPIQQSALGLGVVSLVPAFYTDAESAGLALPKLVMLPLDYRDEVEGTRKGLQYLQINFSKLDGATCMKCRGKMVYDGYQFRRGTLLSPKFHCSQCGRTTDGCQSFEGFHTIYGRCPVDLAKEGIRFDCGVWTNDSFIVPKGPCPIDGKVFSEEDIGMPED